MKMATESAHTGEADESLEQVQQRFAQWRANRQRGAHIPDVLWTAAQGMAQRYGVQYTAQVLRLDHERLERRLQRGAAPTPAGPIAPQFVELFASPASGAVALFVCQVEMETARGGKMRVELNSVDGLVSLAGAFWSAG